MPVFLAHSDGAVLVNVKFLISLVSFSGDPVVYDNRFIFSAREIIGGLAVSAD